MAEKESKTVRFNLDTDVVIGGKSKKFPAGTILPNAPESLLKQVAKEMQKKKNRRFEFA